MAALRGRRRGGDGGAAWTATVAAWQRGRRRLPSLPSSQIWPEEGGGGQRGRRRRLPSPPPSYIWPEEEGGKPIWPKERGGRPPAATMAWSGGGDDDGGGGGDDGGGGSPPLPSQIRPGEGGGVAVVQADLPPACEN
uniref:Uncharacterized protein n=1 Tax=Oryza sativa subsp. japonica TaxID=39947 RepID=Q6K4F3_ORYSJ|nr:hypothetical protein [Oryza sativa Japonica Group]